MVKYKKMDRLILKENSKNILYKYSGYSKFNGCQCNNDCVCHDLFISEYYEFYTVCRKNKKTTNHATYKEALNRWNYVNTL